MGYLGKISAIVTANTGDFSRNLNAAASDVRKFAGAVQSNLTRAASDAERSFKGIYTPLQTLERSLKAAATMKLSFKGFDGAIRDLNVLKERLTAVKGTQIDLILKASGLRTITEFREAIKDISNESFNFAIKFGGIDKLKLIREELRGVSDTSITAVLEAGGLARLKELKETVSSLNGNQLSLALKVGGTEKLTKVEQQAVGLSRKDMNLLVKVGGADALDKIVEELSGVNSRSLDALINVKGVAELDAVISRFQRLTPEAIQAVIKVIGTQDLDAAMNKMRQMYSASQQVFKPLDEAAAKFGTMSAAVQDAFAPALISAQRAAENLKDDIDSGATIGVQRFNSLAAAADKVRESVDRISEASGMIAAFNPGTSLQFVEPETVATVSRANELQRDTLSRMTPGQLRGGRFASRSFEIANELQELARRRAVKERVEAEGPGDNLIAAARYQDNLATANRLIDEQRAKIESLADAWEQAAAKQGVLMGQLKQDTDSEAATIIRREQAAKQLELERQAQEQRASENETAVAIRRERRNKEEGLTGFRTDLPPGYLERRTREQLFGRDIEDPRRRMDAVVSGTNTLKGQVAQLSAPLRGQMVADIRAAEQEFMRLKASIDPSADAIAAAEARLRQLEGTARRLSAIDAFGRSFGNIDEYLADSQVRRAGGELEALRGVIGGVRETPRNRERLAAARQAYGDLFAARSAELQLPADATQAQREEASRRTQVTQERAVVAAATASGRSRSRVRRIVTRGGDVGRMGADSASLALNQLAFAVDDFMSSTGGIEFKLRAISNNITQMAFVLGGTTGLFIGLGAVFAGQLAIGLMKWMNNGRSAEDQTKSLNDALTKQKSLVDAVAESFRSLADEATSGVLSDAGKFQQDILRLEQTQKERTKSAIASTDPDVILARTEQAKLQRQLSDESTPGRRSLLQSQLEAAKAAEQEAIRRAASAPVPTAGDVLGRLADSATQVELGRAAATSSPLMGPFSFLNSAVADLIYGTSDTGSIRGLSAGVSLGSGLDDIRTQIDALNQANALLEPSSKRRTIFGTESRESFRAEMSLAANSATLSKLQAQLQAEIDAAMLELIQSIRGPAEAIRDAHGEVAEAIKAGIPAARMFAVDLDAAGALLKEGLKEIEDAQQEADAVWRSRREAAGRSMVDEALSQRDEINTRADALRFERTVDPQRQAAAMTARAQDNLSAAGLGDGVLARRMREIEFDRETLQKQSQQFSDPMSQRLFAESEEAMNKEIAAIEAATIAVRIFAESLSRASQEAKSNLGSAEQAADDARRADLGFSTPRTQEERRRAEADLERQREVERRARTEIEVATARQEELAASPDGIRLREINEQLQGGGVTGDAREALIRERADIQGRMEADARASGARARAAVDESTMEEERRKQAARGRELMRTPDSRFDEETAAGLEAIRQDFGRRAEEGNGLIDQVGLADAEARYRQQRAQEARTATISGRGQEMFLNEQEKFARDIRDAGGLVESMAVGAIDQAGVGNIAGQADLLRKGIANQMEQIAPMLQQFQDERQSAMLLGPSRAALNISDITTGQGASELTRLLRGDDSARDVNLAELQKQTQKFDELITAIKEANPGVLL